MSASNMNNPTNPSSRKSEESQNSNNTTIDDNTCVVCFKNVDTYSIGECDHPVCYECSTRMRVLCQQNECPICRHVLSKVIFTTDKLPYRELEAKNRSEYYSKKYKICFYTSRIQQSFFDLLDHPCPKCDCMPYRTFQGLRNHVRKEHDLHYCDLCIENLKIFTFERRCYTQTELGMHRTKGDTDNRSHRGHPLCEYCNKRFLDRDELFRHLRREHYFCHFCDADGCNEFYKDYDALAEHFRQEHYLCEEGKCATEQFVGAFRTDIDFKAHVAAVHGKTMNKQQNKQTRTLQLEITLGPRGRSGQTEQGIANLRSRGNENVTHEEPEEYITLTSSQSQRPVSIDARNEEDFPSLGSSGPAPMLNPAVPLAMRNRSTISGLARTKENFPALGGNTGGGGELQQRQKTAPISSVLRKGTASTGAVPRASSSTSANNGMFIHVSNRHNGSNGNNNSNNVSKKTSAMDFPALPAGTVTKSATSTTSSANNGMFIHVSNRQIGSNGNNNSNNANKKPSTMDFPALPAGAVTKSSTSTNSSANTGMFKNVSNRSNGSNGNNNSINANKKPSTLEFPGLLAAKSKKKSKQLALEEDMLPGSNIPMTNVAAKHRTMVDDYVSVANPSHFHKLQMVQKEELEAKNRQAAAKANAPQLTTFDFPSLGGGMATQPAQWINKGAADKKSKEPVESRKSKVAPAPFLSKDNKKPQFNKVAGNNNSSSAPLSEPTSKNEKQKEKKLTADNNGNKSNDKTKERNNNNENKSSNANLNTLANVDTFPTTPPGFHSNVTLKSVAKPPNNLTFTTSMGTSYNIVPSHAYIEPPDAMKRNQKLVTYFKDALNTPEALVEFRHITQKFRERVYKANAYYEHCVAALNQKFEQVFPELLALLPDIAQQQDLYLIHQQRLSTMSPTQRNAYGQLTVCSMCKQVLLTTDADNHHKMHALKDNFPSLGSGAGTQKTGNRK